MPRPIVEVLQSVARIQTTVTDPTQATVIVGPNYEVIDYDSSSADKESSKISDGYDPYGYGATVSTSESVDLSSRGELDTESIEVYFENAFFEVGRASSNSLRSTYDGSAKTVANMLAEVADWEFKFTHTDGALHDTSYSNGIQANSTDAALQYTMATEFRPSTDFTNVHLGYLQSALYYVQVDVDAASVSDIPVFTFNDTLSSSLKHIDLYEAADSGAGVVFSKLNAGVLLVTEGAACTIKIYDVATDTIQATYTGTLHVPSQQSTLSAVANDFSFVETSDRLRQFVCASFSGEQVASGRLEAELSRDFDYPDGVSIYLENKDPDWAYSASNETLTFSSEVTLQDVNLANASALADKVITRADMFIQSRGLITTEAYSAKVVTSLNLESELGEVSSKNPLALAASIALQNSGTSSIKYMRISSDNSEGLLKALPFLNSDPDVYAILPLTQDLSVINSYAIAAVNQSAPEVGKFRIVLGSAETAPLWRYWAGSRGSEYGKSAANLASGFITNALKADTNAGTAVISDPEGGYLAVGGPAVGDTLEFHYVDNAGTEDAAPDLTSKFTCEVKSIQSNSQLTVDLPTAGEVVANENRAVLYTGAKDIKDDRAAQIVDLLGAIAPLTSNADLAKRLVMVYPGEVSIGLESGLPGYYLTAAVGGMLAAFEPHRPKNQIALSGIADIEYSNLGFFTDSEIDQLSDGGYFVLIQEIPGGLPFCVHQVTLAYRNYAGTQEYSELSVVNNFDYISSVFKRSLQPYVGVWNVIPQAYSSIMASLDSAILSLRSRSVDRIGAPLLGGDVVSVAPSEADAGTVNVLLEVQLPKVLNKIRLEIVSQ